MIHTIERVITTEQRFLAEEFVNQNHSYITWKPRPSRVIHWLLYEDFRLVGVWSLGSAFVNIRRIKIMMRAYEIKQNEIANNIVCCLSGCMDRNAGSKLLALLRKDAQLWWQERYGDQLKAFETFILPPRNGAMYKADNWEYIGRTLGDGQAITSKWGFKIRSFKKVKRKLIFIKLC